MRSATHRGRRLSWITSCTVFCPSPENSLTPHQQVAPGWPHLISDLPLVELKVQLRFLSHCNQTPFVQRSASVWQKILRAAWLIEIRCFLFLLAVGCALFQQNQIRSAHSQPCCSFDRHAAGQTSIILRDLQVARVVSGRGKQRCALQVSTLTAVSSVRAHPGPHDWRSSREGLTQTTPCALPLRSCSSGLGSSLQNLLVNLPSSRSSECRKNIASPFYFRN